MKKPLMFVVLLAMSFLVREVIRQYMGGETVKLGDSKEEILKILRKEALKLNKSLPKQLDEHTRHLRVDITNEGMVHKYRVLPPYTFFLLNGDMELNRDLYIFI